MTTQAQDLGKTLGASVIAAADKHGTAIVAASIHIHTGLSQIAEALGYRNPAGRRQDAPGAPRMPGRVEPAAEPLRGAQDATQPGTDMTAVVVRDNEGDLWGRRGAEFTALGDIAGAGTALLAQELVQIYGPLTVILDANGNPPKLYALEQSRNDIAGAWASVCEHIALAPDVSAGEFNTAVDALAARYHATGYEQGLKDTPAPAVDGNPPTPEPEWLDADQLDQLPRLAVVLPKHTIYAHQKLTTEERNGWYSTPINSRGEYSGAIAPARVLWTPEADR